MIDKSIDWDTYIAIAIKDLDAVGVQYVDLSDDAKKRATSLEHEISLYARHDDLNSFIMAVRDWRDLMIEDLKGKEQ